MISGVWGRPPFAMGNALMKTTKLGGEISGRPAPSPVPSSVPPFWPKPEKMTPREAYSVVIGPGVGIPSGAEMSSKLMKVAVTGGGTRGSAVALWVRTARARTPTSKLRVRIGDSFPRGPGPATRRPAPGARVTDHYGTATNCALPGRLSEPGPG